MSTTPVGDYLNKRYPPNPGATHWLGDGDDPGCCAGGHARCTYDAGWREAHASLAAWFERAATQMHADAADPAQREELKAIGPDVGSVIGALRYAAEIARGAAGASSSEASGPAPVSGEAPERSRDCGDAQREALGRLVREVWVTWASEQPDPKPSWLTGWDGLDAGQREVDVRIGTAVAAAERERIAAGLERRAQVTPANPYGQATAVSYREVGQLIRDGLPGLERAAGEPG